MAEFADILSAEHKNIMIVIKAIRKECLAIDSGKAPDKNFFHSAIDFVKNYADKFHHAKEEDILFKEMCADGVNLHCNPVDQMLYEHDLGRNYIRNLEQALEADDPAKVTENARGYALLLEDHIFKEDNILYPMAVESLPRATQDALVERFAEAESKQLSGDAKEKYIDFVKEAGRQ